MTRDDLIELIVAEEDAKQEKEEAKADRMRRYSNAVKRGKPSVKYDFGKDKLRDMTRKKK